MTKHYQDYNCLLDGGESPPLEGYKWLLTWPHRD